MAWYYDKNTPNKQVEIENQLLFVQACKLKKYTFDMQPRWTGFKLITFDEIDLGKDFFFFPFVKWYDTVQVQSNADCEY